MLRTRTGELLDAWLDQVERSKLPELQSFAAGVQKDKDAVRACKIRLDSYAISLILNGSSSIKIGTARCSSRYTHLSKNSSFSESARVRMSQSLTALYTPRRAPGLSDVHWRFFVLLE